MLASPRFSVPTSLRSFSTLIGCGKVVRIICPPTKSTPRLRPRTPTMAKLAIVTTIEMTSARLRQRMKSRLVLSGTSFRSFMCASDMQYARPLAPHPDGDEHSREIDGSEHRRDDSDHQYDGKAPDRARAEV